MPILVLNCGSSSVKFAVIDPTIGSHLIVGLGQRLDSPQATLNWQDATGNHEQARAGASHEIIIGEIAKLLERTGQLTHVVGIGHRVVHGGSRFARSVLINDQVEAGIEACNHLGPLHNPPNLIGIRLCGRFFPGLKQAAVFDTAFHQTMPAKAFRYAVPDEWYFKHDVRRYGFHGTSHRFVTSEAARRLALPPERCQFVIAHLGNGCSATAVKNGQSVDTTMGLTPLEGLVMGTRSGDIDPAVIGYMADRLGCDAKKVIDILNKQSGLLGLSGVSNDMRVLLAAAEAGNEKARLAIDVFSYRLAKHLLGLCAALERLDAVIFTGGIGENSPPIRAATVAQLKVLGLELDPAANAVHGAAHGSRISSPQSIPVLVVSTNEELLIARDTAALLNLT
ncbi:MAG: acetate kinase [Planctomycetota bacterium]